MHNKRNDSLACSYWFQASQINTVNFLNCSIWSPDETLTSTTSTGQRWHESNDDEGILHILLKSRPGASSPDSV